MKYWTYNEKTNTWMTFVDHHGNHRYELLTKGIFVDHHKPVQILTSKEINQIMTNQSWEGIKS